MDPKKIICTELEKVEGADIVWMMQLKFPWPMSNRVIINASYFTDNEDGTYQQCGSSKGNEDIVEKNKKTIGKDVVAFNHLGYIHIKDTEDGCEWSTCACMDLGGSIPGMLQGKIATR